MKGGANKVTLVILGAILAGNAMHQMDTQTIHCKVGKLYC